MARRSIDSVIGSAVWLCWVGSLSGFGGRLVFKSSNSIIAVCILYIEERKKTDYGLVETPGIYTLLTVPTSKPRVLPCVPVFLSVRFSSPFDRFLDYSHGESTVVSS